MKALYLPFLITLAACTNDGYTGNQSSEDKTPEPVAIEFAAGSNRSHTRADLTGDAAATALNNFFRVYGTKAVGESDLIVYPTYMVQYKGAPNSTESNTQGWEYVGLEGYANQTIHYWDYSASSYTFQAWSTTTGHADVTVTSKNTLTVKAASADDLSRLYVADLVNVAKSASTSGLNTYGGVVTFTFRNMAAKVRMGFYETIPGYTVSNLTFRSAAGRFDNTNAHAMLDGSFNAADATKGGTYHVTYNAETQRAEFDLVAETVPAETYDFGTFSSGVIGTESSTPTWVGGTPAFQNVLPNEDNAGDMTLYVDFTLTPTDGSEDVIHVTGAKVVVPQSVMTWHPNYAYTYLFKITKDVNGTTGEEGTDPEKLYPITFDAIVAEMDETTDVYEKPVE